MALLSPWWNYNDKLWNGKAIDAAGMLLCNEALLLGWLAAKEFKHKSYQQQMKASQIKWTKPHQGFLKCNVDASFDNSGNYTSYGLGIRDDIGGFMMEKTELSVSCIPVLEEKALGLLKALKWGWSWIWFT